MSLRSETRRMPMATLITASVMASRDDSSVLNCIAAAGEGEERATSQCSNPGRRLPAALWWKLGALFGAVFFAVYLLVTPAWMSIVTHRAEPANAASAAPAQVSASPRSSVARCGIEALARNHGVCA
jgi:hypothetical protein